MIPLPTLIISEPPIPDTDMAAFVVCCIFQQKTPVFLILPGGSVVRLCEQNFCFLSIHSSHLFLFPPYWRFVLYYTVLYYTGKKFSIRHDYKINSWILEKPGNSWKILEKIWTSETGFNPEFLFIPDFILNSRILPSQAPTNHLMILLDILCLANLNEMLLFYYISWVFLRPIKQK